MKDQGLILLLWADGRFPLTLVIKLSYIYMTENTTRTTSSSSSNSESKMRLKCKVHDQEDIKRLQQNLSILISGFFTADGRLSALTTS